MRRERVVVSAVGEAVAVSSLSTVWLVVVVSFAL